MDFIYFSRKPFGWAEKKLVDEVVKLGYEAAVYDWDQVEITSDAFLYEGKELQLPKVAMVLSRVRTRHVKGERLYLFDWIELMESKGVKFLNSPKAIRQSSNKVYAAFLLSSSGIRVPKTRLVNSLEQIGRALEDWKDIILKPVSGNGSIDIKRLYLDDHRFGDEIAPILNVFQESEIWHTLNKHKELCAQEYIPNEGKDIRVNVVDNKVVSICGKNALPNTWITKDINKGMKMTKYELTPEIEKICINAVKVLGLDYAPIDLVEGPEGPTIIEVNSAIAIWPDHETSGITIDPEGSVKYYINMILGNMIK